MLILDLGSRLLSYASNDNDLALLHRSRDLSFVEVLRERPIWNHNDAGRQSPASSRPRGVKILLL